MMPVVLDICRSNSERLVLSFIGHGCESDLLEFQNRQDIASAQDLKNKVFRKI